ncbi:Vitamin B12 import ATP-binding protein BtuD [Methanimicrococcus sp. At1]|uniref:Vitamin B12 import ATP-binding protein BtuD n=1 Tax=Methanimicrococcus hacksteinii TaxID=3028293 RepID=A0ABU3VRK1_9EURY|nr:ABC transporter ATP-binding protein [Methanimicrococcus sp. At1]MDV0446043.1 Vitamin B12 import ATP-binding protein BtuD [Methanimicrococcus sp. At1]
MSSIYPDLFSENTPVLDVEHLWVRYDTHTVLEDVSLRIDGPGEILGIIGPNGGGKTTFLKSVLGLIPISKGSISVFGLPPEKARPYIGYVPQYSKYDYDFPISVMEVVLTGRLKRAGLFHRYSKEDKEAAMHALETVGMTEYKDAQIGQISGGQRQRVFIARALSNDPKFLLMDEPNTGLDTFMQDELYRILDELKKKMAIIVISHDIGAVSAHMDKIACLNRRLYFHDNKEMSREDFIAAYGCSIDLVAHGMPHRVLGTHPYAHGADDSACGCGCTPIPISGITNPESDAGDSAADSAAADSAAVDSAAVDSVAADSAAADSAAADSAAADSAAADSAGTQEAK